MSRIFLNSCREPHKLTFLVLESVVANCENNKHGQSITKNVLLNRFWMLCKWPLKSEKYSSCNLSGIFSFYNIIIAQIFIHLIDSSVLNLMVLRGLAPNTLLLWFLHGSLHCACVYSVLPYGILNIHAIIYYDADNDRRREQNVSHLYSKCHFHVKHAQLSKQKNSKHSHAFITHTLHVINPAPYYLYRKKKQKWY